MNQQIEGTLCPSSPALWLFLLSSHLILSEQKVLLFTPNASSKEDFEVGS